ncbi:universal stress protein [Catalinimonas niigatensis]|uniref:universal stress protein n=1 Tax=Catalinimonas niigatensis TaxID=1397264 RepID=UPI002666AADC|nr:universal stress protein [Catalinimonas niigatensis]WPP52024.1 universal stress protein [Catalinimonas niigatensis]
MNIRNRIILLIDFSEYSENLTDFAFTISEIINAKVVFAHQISGIAPGMADRETKDEIVKAELQEVYSKLLKLAKRRVYSEDSFYVSQKSILTILKELTSKDYFDWVFAGLKGTGVLKSLFIGSTILSIINKSDLLTMVVPARSQISVPEKLMVGVNPKYSMNKHQFGVVLDALRCQIKTLEFFTVLKVDADEEKAKNHLLGLQTEYEVHKPGIQLYKGNRAFDFLKDRVELTENSFLVLQQRSRSISDKLFRKFMINELVYGGQTPLTVLSK